MLKAYAVLEVPLTVTGPMKSIGPPPVDSAIVSHSVAAEHHPMLIAFESTVTLADADFDESALLMAATVTVADDDRGEGAVNSPEEEIMPVRALPPSIPFTLHVTPPAPPLTVAENCWLPPVGTTALDGDMDTPFTDPPLEPPPHPEARMIENRTIETMAACRTNLKQPCERLLPITPLLITEYCGTCWR
jgi:hypothetical protein